MLLQNYRWFFRGVVPFATCSLLFAMMLGCAAPAGSPKADSGSPKVAPNFSLSGYKGRVVLLDFWATWCHGCRTEIPWYMEFENKYKVDGLAVVGVSMDIDWKTVKPFMAEEKMNYPVVIGNEDLLALYGSHEMPATYLIDRHGTIADYHIGVVNKDQFESEIKKLLRQPH